MTKRKSRRWHRSQRWVYGKTVSDAIRPVKSVDRKDFTAKRDPRGKTRGERHLYVVRFLELS